LAISEAEFVGHKVTSSRSSSSVQRDMIGLGHPAPGPGLPIRAAPFWRLHLVGRAARLKRSVEPCHSSMLRQRDPARMWRFKQPFEKRDPFTSWSLCSLSAL
jgi:hypothetical protein